MRTLDELLDEILVPAEERHQEVEQPAHERPAEAERPTEERHAEAELPAEERHEEPEPELSEAEPPQAAEPGWIITHGWGVQPVEPPLEPEPSLQESDDWLAPPPDPRHWEPRPANPAVDVPAPQPATQEPSVWVWEAPDEAGTEAPSETAWAPVETPWETPIDTSEPAVETPWEAPDTSFELLEATLPDAAPVPGPLVAEPPAASAEPTAAEPAAPSGYTPPHTFEIPSVRPEPAEPQVVAPPAVETPAAGPSVVEPVAIPEARPLAPPSGPVVVPRRTHRGLQPVVPRGPDDPLGHARPLRQLRRERKARIQKAALLIAGAGVLAVGGWLTLQFLARGREPRPVEPLGPIVEQQVVAWSVWDEHPDGPAFVGVVASGGDKNPVLLLIPQTTIVSVPGRGLETFGDAAGVGDPDVVAAAVENVLGVQVDASTGMPLANLVGLVDRIGGIEVQDEDLEDEDLDGQGAVQYLRAGGDNQVDNDLRFIRWLEVATAIVGKAHEQPALLQEIPEDLRPVFAAAGGGEAEILDLPVEAIGAGLNRPDADKMTLLVQDLFVPTAKTDGVVRLVVLNGNGRPGVGQEVARVLVPAGFRTVSSLNAAKFNVERTSIVASSEEFLDEALLAQQLLGVGDVYVSEQRSLVADVSVLVGKDFLRR